jgi:hypothetical protein
MWGRFPARAVLSPVASICAAEGVANVGWFFGPMLIGILHRKKTSDLEPATLYAGRTATRLLGVPGEARLAGVMPRQHSDGPLVCRQQEE